MRLTKIRTPVASTDRKDGEFGNDDGGADGSSNFLRGLDSEADVTVAIANYNNCLKSSPLTSPGLFLHRLDLQTNLLVLIKIMTLSEEQSLRHAAVGVLYLHHLVFQLRQEEVHNLKFLDR